MKKWHKEPLVHFLILGALIFFLFSFVKDEKSNVAGNKIVISTADMERLSVNWARKWNRPPTEAELKRLVETFIREEVYYREALALGLDRNDTVLRRRLMQKMEFMTNDLAELTTPDEDALNQFFLDNQDKYELPARVSFTHIYFSVDKRGARAASDAKRALSELATASGSVPRAPQRGDSFMLPYDFTRESPFEVARVFGSGFADRLFQTGINAWQGPIESGYGLHLVRIREKIDSRVPELAEVIDKVRNDWMYEQRQKTNEAVYRKLKERYEIVVDEMPKRSGMAKATVPEGES
jgi:hypothetical protein